MTLPRNAWTSRGLSFSPFDERPLFFSGGRRDDRAAATKVNCAPRRPLLTRPPPPLGSSGDPMLNRMMKTAAMALAALLLASCGSGTVHGIDLAITDAPIDVASSVNISFTRIEF